MKRRGMLILVIVCFVLAGLLLALLIAISPARATPFQHERPAEAYQPVTHEIVAPYDYSPHLFRYRR